MTDTASGFTKGPLEFFGLVVHSLRNTNPQIKLNYGICVLDSFMRRFEKFPNERSFKQEIREGRIFYSAYKDGREIKDLN